MEEIKATMLSIRYRNAERSWLVAQMISSDSKETFIATGDIPYSESEEVLQLHGEWVEDKKYGKQFKTSTAYRVLPTSTSGLKAYLASSEDIKGIGPVRANKLAEFFGSKLLFTLDNCPEKLSTCPGISVELAKTIADSWKSDSSIRQLSIYLGQHNISPRWAGKILKQWDAGTAITLIQSNPYALTAIEGIGFVTADEIALSLGGKKDSQERIDAACLYVVQKAVQNGNVFLHEHQLIEEVVKLITPRGKNEEQVREKATQSINTALDNKELICEEITDGISSLKLIYLPYLYRAEKALAEDIVEMNDYDHLTSPRLSQVLIEVQEKQHVQFSAKQMEAIRGSFSNHILVITGGPGTGKTTCTKAICEVAEKLHAKLALCAPTGRAAKRLAEVTGRDATTIHRLLKWKEGEPTHRRGNPIEADVLIVDEASMLDLDLGSKLLEAIPTQCSIILIGDIDQLPAIGAGATLRDIISSNTVRTITLDTIFRQAEQSLIVRNAHLIRRGEVPRFPETKGVKENSYVMWIPPAAKGSEGGRDDAEWLKKKLAEVVSIHIPTKLGSESKPIDPIRDIQVLVPMKKNTLGTFELNKVLQAALNSNGEEFTAGGKVFRIGDRVMQMRNNYEEGMDIYNGDIGFITQNLVEEKAVSVNFYGRNVSIPYSDLGDIQLAYAQTIHKAQGSEYPIVIIVMAYQHWAMLERNLLYTANTRAKDMCLFMASKGAIERAVKNNPVKERNTYLAQRLKIYTNKEAINA